MNDASFKIGGYKSLKEAAIDLYVAIRDAYVQYRMNMVKKVSLSKWRGTAMGMCPECGRKLKKTELKEFHYRGYGLDNVHLEGITQYECQKCGRHRLKIPDVLALHFLIAVNLVFKTEPLTHRETGYLIKVIRQKCWRAIDCCFEDSYQSGPMMFRWTDGKWQYFQD